MVATLRNLRIGKRMEGRGKGSKNTNSFRERSIYLELDEGIKKDYKEIKEALLHYLRPPETRCIVLHEFESRKSLPGESPQEFLYSLKQLLIKAIPEMDMYAREQVLLHRFISGHIC